MAWTTVLESCRFEEWQSQVHDLLGPHESRLLDTSSEQRFVHRIRATSLGEVQLVELRGGGAFTLERLQAEDRAVLWLPWQGVIHETVEGRTFSPEPGMGLWVRPATALCGEINGSCCGVSIVVPLQLLQLERDVPYEPDPEAGPMLLNPFSRQRSEAMVSLLQIAWDLVKSVDDPEATLQRPLVLDSLLQHLREWDQSEPWPAAPISRAEQYCRDAEAWIGNHLDQAISVRDVADALHLSQRTLQQSFRSQRDVTPTEAIQRLRRWRLAALQPDRSP